MGGGSWDDKTYFDKKAARKKTKKDAFAYDASMQSVPSNERKVNRDMNPKNVTRESRDSAAHPESLAIMLVIDVTGSMKDTPRIFQSNLPKLMGLLLKRGYVPHPQILFGAVGDASVGCDKAPLQTGQFESGIEMDNDLSRLFLEAGGGGQMKESYELVPYFAARHTAIDCFEKRGKKGYLFIVGDELPYAEVVASQVKKIIGDDLRKNISIEGILAEASKKYEIFFVIPNQTSYWGTVEITKRWSALLGSSHVLRLENPEALSELVAVAIGVTERKVTLADALSHLKESGTDTKVARSITKTLKELEESLADSPRPDTNKSKTKPGTATEEESLEI